MAFNGSGVFNRLYSWVTDAANAIKISSTRMDAEMDGMATGLSTCITKDGQTTITANLPMSNFRHTGVGAASARTDYARASQVQDSSLKYAAAGGTVDAITVALSPAITAYAAGLRVHTIATGANTGAVTFNVNGVGATAVKKAGGNALVAGDIPGAGYGLDFLHDGTDWELLNPAPVTIAGTQSITGTKTMSAAAFNTAVRVDVASAATTNLDTAASNHVNITGTTTVTAITLTDGRSRNCRADGALPITTGASLIINGLASGTTHTFAAGDTFVAVGEPSGVVRIVSITRVTDGADGLLKTTAASGASEVDFVLAGGFRRFEIHYDTIVSTDGAELNLRLSKDGGSSFLATGYKFNANESLSDGTNAPAGSASTTEIPIAVNVGSAVTEGSDGRVVIYNPASTTRFKNVMFDTVTNDNTAGFLSKRRTGGGAYVTDADALNAVRILPSAGTVTGTFKLYGYA